MLPPASSPTDARPPAEQPWLDGEGWRPALQADLALGQALAGDRARQLTALLAQGQSWVTYLSSRRDQAVLELRQEGASYDEVARALGVTKSRAQQLVRRLEQPAG